MHIPRTGGTTVERVIEELGINKSRIARKHRRLWHHSKSRKMQIKKVFTFVRDPFCYYQSVWKWLSRCSEKSFAWMQNQTWHPHHTAAKYYDKDFNAWVLKMVEEEPAWVTRIYESYCGPEHAEYAQFIGRAETLMQDLTHVLKMYRLIHRKAVLPKVMPQHVIRKTIQWDTKAWNAISQSDKRALERFYSDSTINQRIYKPVLRMY